MIASIRRKIGPVGNRVAARSFSVAKKKDDSATWTGKVDVKCPHADVDMHICI